MESGNQFRPFLGRCVAGNQAYGLVGISGELILKEHRLCNIATEDNDFAPISCIFEYVGKNHVNGGFGRKTFRNLVRAKFTVADMQVGAVNFVGGDFGVDTAKISFVDEFREVFSSNGYCFDPGILGTNPKRNERFVAVGCFTGTLCSS